jgi:hypothetical protein
LYLVCTEDCHWFLKDSTMLVDLHATALVATAVIHLAPLTHKVCKHTQQQRRPLLRKGAKDIDHVRNSHIGCSSSENGSGTS